MNVATIATVAVVILMMLNVISFLLGYFAADRNHIAIQKSLHGQLRFAQRQRAEIGLWVQTNWPDEYAAYQKGVLSGYQSGIEHADQLHDEAEPAP